MEGCLALWYFLQGSIIFAVVSSNIVYQWTPNKYLAGLLGALTAFVATALIGNLILWARKQRRQ